MRKDMLGITVPMNRCPLLLIIVSSLLSAWGNVIYEGLCNPAHRLNNINVHRQYVERSTKRVLYVKITTLIILAMLMLLFLHHVDAFLHLPDLLSRAQLYANEQMQRLPASAESYPPPDTEEKVLKKKYFGQTLNKILLIYNSQMYYFLSNYIHGLV